MFAFRSVLLRRRVVVNLVNGHAVQGVLFQQLGPLLVLKNATLLEPGAEPLSLDGDVVVERDRVLFIQAL